MELNNGWLKKLLGSLVASVILILVLVFIFSGLKRDEKLILENNLKVSLGQCEFKVAVARTAEEQARGLGGIKKLNSDQAMLFPFTEAQIKNFWMKGMLIPIDLVWLKQNEVVGLEENMLPDNGSTIYPAPAPVDLVLEAASGAVKRCEIKVGSKLIQKN